MGQAKIKRKFAEKYLREIIARNTAPLSEFEQELAIEVGELEFEPFYAPNSATLKADGLIEKECHHNCQKYVTQFADCQIVIGWMWVSDDYILHSVIRDGNTGRLIDITPRLSNVGKVRFAPDPAIQMTVSPGTKAATTRISFERDGAPFYIEIVRRNQEAIHKQAAEIERALANGVHPYAALPGLDLLCEHATARL